MAKVPVLSVYKTLFVHLHNDGTEVKDSIGIRVLLQYAESTDENRAFEVLTIPTFMLGNMSPIELSIAARDSSSELQDIFQFAEERLPGLTIGGEQFSWDTLAADGYDFTSPSRTNGIVR